ncbi:hypothetical protein ACIRRH_32120 [Kitasatospora sp. NPDC101235]|uniref:hypothetical protein n=1 Tax=Kitasatospora sp. NPDC101235 TaxID=3364101 RepID=UPI003822B7AB
MPADPSTYIDHADLTTEDFATFERLRAYLPDTHPRWALVYGINSSTPGGRWASTEALFELTGPPLGAAGRFARVYFDEHGKALPDRPADPVTSPFAEDLADHLPGWSVEPLPLRPGRDLADLHDRVWSWSWPGFTSTTAPHTALALTGPAGEHLLAVRPGADAPLLVGAARPDDAVHLLDGTPELTVPVSSGVEPDMATLAAEITGTLAPRYRQVLWRARADTVTYTVHGLQDLSDALIGDHPWSDTRDRSIQLFESERDRNRRAWYHVEVLLDTGQHVVAGIRSNAHVEDLLDPFVGPHLRRLHAAEKALAHLQEIQDRWRDAQAALLGPPDDIEPLLRRAEALRDQEAWPFARWLAHSQLPALTRHVTPRVGIPLPDRDQQMKAARARASNLPAWPSPAAPTLTAAPPPGRHRPTR